jgi:hypothetical protein
MKTLLVNQMPYSHISDEPVTLGSEQKDLEPEVIVVLVNSLS